MIVYGGLEPLRFTNIFPFWEPDKTITGLAMVVSETVILALNRPLTQIFPRYRFSVYWVVYEK